MRQIVVKTPLIIKYDYTRKNNAFHCITAGVMCNSTTYQQTLYEPSLYVSITL